MLIAESSVIDLQGIGRRASLRFLDGNPLAVNLHLPKLPAHTAVLWLQPNRFPQERELPGNITLRFSLHGIREKAIRGRAAVVGFIAARQIASDNRDQHAANRYPENSRTIVAFRCPA